MKKKNVLYSPRIAQIKRKKRKILKVKIIFFVFIFLLLLTGLIFLSRWPRLNIDKIQVKGNKIVEVELIEKIVQEELVGKYFWVFPKTNFIIYPQNKLENELKNKLKRIKKVFINDRNIKTLEISVEEYDGKYLYCGTTFNEYSNELSPIEECYFLDSSGYIFDQAPYFSGEVYFKFFGPINSKNEIAIGNYFEENNFAKIITFIEQIKQMDLKPVAFLLNESGEGNISLSSNLALPFAPKIIFKMDADFDKLAENLHGAITVDPLKTNLLEKYGSLQYIDLRYGNKVYYKFN